MRRSASIVVFVVIVMMCLPTLARPAGDTLERIVEDAWQWTLSRDLGAQWRHDVKDLTFPAQGVSDVKAAAEFAGEIIERIERLGIDNLDHQDQVLAGFLKSRMNLVIAEHTYYWLKPVLTPYQLGLAVNAGHQIVQGFEFSETSDLARYDRLLAGSAQWLNDAHTRSEGSARRGMAPAKAALPGIRGTLAGLKTAAAAVLPVAEERLDKLDLTESEFAEFNQQVAARVDEIEGWYDSLQSLVDEVLSEHAPSSVGLAQYEGGLDYYAYLIRLYTSTDSSPESLHEFGLEYVKDIELRMETVRDRLSFPGSHQDFLQKIRTDARFVLQTPEEVEALYNEYIRRIEPLIPEYFHKIPRAPYRVARLDASLEGSITYGFYREPGPDRPYGTYYYNASNLEDRPIIVAAGLMYHELLPGHHFHIARQLESEDLHPMRQLVSLDASAYNEGWAEYAAGTLAREMGLYEDDYEEYGRLLMDMFFAVRIVVDTGMNALGWSLERAQQFMEERLITSTDEILTESVRYSTDLPGQALAYGIGPYLILQMREHMRNELGDAFDVRDFHEAVLSIGAVPLDVLEMHVRWSSKQKLQ